MRIDTHATGAEEYLKSMKKAKCTTLGLRALNDIVIIEEDKMTAYEGTLVIPDAYEYWAKKFPCTGELTISSTHGNGFFFTL